MTFEIIFKFLFAILIGSLIGIERELAKKPAGLRTHVLITLGSTIFTVSAINYFPIDSAARIIANIVVGIGFVGAGTIFLFRDKIIGLTTAASLWISAALGLVIGLGLYEIAFVAAILTLIVLYGFKIIEKRLHKSF